MDQDRQARRDRVLASRIRARENALASLVRQAEACVSMMEFKRVCKMIHAGRADVLGGGGRLLHAVDRAARRYKDTRVQRWVAKEFRLSASDYASVGLPAPRASGKTRR
jgi:hypothetical protein